MELLSRDADLRAKAELTAVGKSCGRVDVDGNRVDLVLETVGRLHILGNDRLAVSRAVFVDVLDRLVKRVYDAERDNVIVKFGLEVLFCGELYALKYLAGVGTAALLSIGKNFSATAR